MIEYKCNIVWNNINILRDTSDLVKEESFSIDATNSVGLFDLDYIHEQTDVKVRIVM